MTVETTYHADYRARKRFKQKDITKDFSMALAEGKSIHDFKGKFGAYLKGLAMKHQSNGVVYKGRAYWFGKNKKLITVYQVDQKWHKYLK